MSFLIELAFKALRPSIERYLIEHSDEIIEKILPELLEKAAAAVEKATGVDLPDDLDEKLTAAAADQIKSLAPNIPIPPATPGLFQ